MSDLFLVVCSGSKRGFGEEVYTPPDAFNRLTDAGATLLEKGRRCSRDILMEKYPRYRLGPVNGFDPNFDRNQDKDPNERYLPAYDRYRGKFYVEIPERCREGLTDIENVDVLILCPLYGIELWAESILNHEAPTSNPPTRCWSRRLTNILIDYIQENHVDRVFDVLTISPFTQLINWSRITRNFGGNVYGNWTNISGWNKLTLLGQFFREYVCTNRYNEAINNEVNIYGNRFAFREMRTTPIHL